MDKLKVKIIISYLLVIIWMIVIFLFSSANGNESGNDSKGIIKGTITIADKIVVNIGLKDELYTDMEKDVIAENLNYPLRKVMHFSEYLILALLWLNALSLSKVKHKYLITLLICVIYAMSDEYHQTFINGRSGQLLDVLIDSTGSFIGTGCYVLLTKIKKRFNF